MFADILNPPPYPIPANVRRVIDEEMADPIAMLDITRRGSACDTVIKIMRADPQGVYSARDFEHIGIRYKSICTILSRLEDRGLIVTLGIRPTDGGRPTRVFGLV